MFINASKNFNLNVTWATSFTGTNPSLWPQPGGCDTRHKLASHLFISATWLLWAAFKTALGAAGDVMGVSRQHFSPVWGQGGCDISVIFKCQASQQTAER